MRCFQKRQLSQAKAQTCYEKWYNDREEQRRQLKLKEKKAALEKVRGELRNFQGGSISMHDTCSKLLHLSHASQLLG